MRRTLRSLSDRLHAVLDGLTPRRRKHARVAALARMLRPVDCGLPLIRLGGPNDGGYLVPDDLDGIASCFSPGVGAVARFERDCAARGIKSFLADGSVEGPPEGLADCDFTRRFLGARDTATVITLDTWLRQSLGDDEDADLILQMDIEGAEFETLNAAREHTLSRFRIAVVEFHHAQRLVRRSVQREWRACFERLTRLFDVAHVHPNTATGIVSLHGFPFPRAFEVTFLRKDRSRGRRPVTDLPHALDAPNLPGASDLPLPEVWYRDPEPERTA